jgi:hypothetical protein
MARLCLIGLLAALLQPLRGDTRLEYLASCGVEPNDVPDLGFASSGLGTGEVVANGGQRLRTADADPAADGRYYSRIFAPGEVDQSSGLRIEVRLRVLSSVGSPASTCVQVALGDRRFGLGFLTNGPGPEDDQVVLLDPAAAGEGQVRASWRVPVGEMRDYVLELLRPESGAEDDVVRLSAPGLPLPPLSVRMADLTPSPASAYAVVVIGHLVAGGTGEAEWERVAMTVTRPSEPSGPLAIGTRRQLFLDDWVIEETRNIQRGQETPVKHPGNPIIRRDKPWEAARCELYGSAVWDPDHERLQLFYSAMHHPYDTKMAYAESLDGGTTWVKPILDVFKWEGQESNIVWPGPYQVHGPSVFRDPDDPDGARRYKLFAAHYPTGSAEEAAKAAGAGIHVAFSPDGIHWTPSARNPALPGFISDTGQCAFWDPATGKYIAYVRIWTNQRCVGRTESEDFETWTTPEIVYMPTAADQQRGWQFYSMSVTPYEGIYVGLVWIFPAVAASGDWNADTPVTWPELAVSRDSRRWERVAFGTPFLPNGPAGAFDHRQIRTASSLVVLDDRILLLYSGSPHPHVSAHNFEIGLATLRRDGFVSLTAGDEEASVLTKPLAFDSGVLRVNASVELEGFVKAELLDLGGRVLEGYGAEQCHPLSGDRLEGRLWWKGRPSMPAAAEGGTRIRFVLKRARLYSFWVEPR